jgi:hypothetical protein
MHCPRLGRRNVKLGIVEQSQFNRLAESANVGLRKQQVGNALPSRASLARRWFRREHGGLSGLFLFLW